jgi:hypothetical protein
MAGQGVLPSLAAAAGATCVMMRLLPSSARGLDCREKDARTELVACPTVNGGASSRIRLRLLYVEYLVRVRCE